MLGGMNTSTRTCRVLLPVCLLTCGLACDSSEPTLGKVAQAQTGGSPPSTRQEPPPPLPTVEGKRVPLNPTKTLFFETLPDGKRRVLIQSEVCLREGMLEVFLCRNQTKEHEAIVHADLDARALHAALEAAGAKPGSPVQYQPQFKPPSGTRVRVLVQYEENGKTVTRPAQYWVRETKSRKELAHDWVFAGSKLYPDPDEPQKQPFYGANSGDVICISNFPDALLDLPINSPKDNSDLVFEAWTERIPPLRTPVLVILEPVVEPKKP